MSTYMDALERIVALHWKTEAGLEDERGNLHDATPMCADCGETGATHEAIVHADDCVIGIAAAALAAGEQDAGLRERARKVAHEQTGCAAPNHGYRCDTATDAILAELADVQREEMERAARIVREEREIYSHKGAAGAAFATAEERIRNRKDHP